MSGNKERLSLGDSRELFSRSCEKCGKSIGFDFGRNRDTVSVRVVWRVYSSNLQVELYDKRTTYKSFEKHTPRCISCWHPVENENIKEQLIMLAKRRYRRWSREYRKEFGIDQK